MKQTLSLITILLSLAFTAPAAHAGGNAPIAPIAPIAPVAPAGDQALSVVISPAGISQMNFNPFSGNGYAGSVSISNGSVLRANGAGVQGVYSFALYFKRGETPVLDTECLAELRQQGSSEKGIQQFMTMSGLGHIYLDGSNSIVYIDTLQSCNFQFAQ